MRKLALFALAAALAANPLAARKPAAPRQIGVEASIPFANSVGIYNFQADGDEAVWIEDQHRRWYHAKLIGSCIDLPWVQGIGVDAGPTGTLDKFGAIIVRDERCQISSLVTSAAPPKKVKKAKKSV